MIKKKRLTMGVFSALAISIFTHTVSNAQVDYQDVYYGQGYTLINRSPIVNNDLNQTINKAINATTVFQGLQQLLSGTGWQIAGLQAADPRIDRLYESTWPSNWSHYVTDSLVNILQTVGGEGWQLVVDPVNRLISYEVKKGYR